MSGAFFGNCNPIAGHAYYLCEVLRYSADAAGSAGIFACNVKRGTNK